MQLLVSRPLSVGLELRYISSVQQTALQRPGNGLPQKLLCPGVLREGASGGGQTAAGSEPEKDQAEALVLTGLLVLKSGRLDWPHRQQESAARFYPVSVLVP